MNNLQTSAAIQSSITVAVVTFDALGDGLVFLVMAEILKRNGYSVIFYSNAIPPQTTV